MSVDRGFGKDVWELGEEQPGQRYVEDIAASDSFSSSPDDLGSLSGTSTAAASAEATASESGEAAPQSSLSVAEATASPSGAAVTVETGPGLMLQASVVARSGESGASSGMPVSCTCCGQMGSAFAGDGSGGSVFAPTTPGTLTELSTFLRSGYWDWANGSGGGAIDWKWGISNISFNVTALTAQEATWAREAFQHVSQICNLTFTETTGSANITFSSPASGGAFANFSGSGGTITSASVSIQDGWASWSPSATSYNYFFQTYLHEIGHALGLGHQGPYNGSATYSIDAQYQNDSWQASIMSYFDQIDNTYNTAPLANGSFAYVSSYMQADIAALQGKYGAPTSGLHFFGIGPTVSGQGFDMGGTSQARSFTMYAHDGWVGLDTSTYTGTQTVNMASGAFSSVFGYTDNVSQYASTMTWYSGGTGIDDITMATSAPAAAGNFFIGGNNGNDIIRSTGTFTNANIDGGAGTDTYTRVLLDLNSSAFLKKTSQSGNAWTVDSSSNDHFLTNVETAQFSNVTVRLRQADANFNFGYANDSGSASDILLQNGGLVVQWTMQNGAYVSGSTITNGAAGWTVASVGDHNADGDADVILQNGGTVVIWNMQNAGYQSGSVITSGAAGYTVKGSGDYNNDGDHDLILQGGGNVVVWQMQNGAYASGAVLSTGLSGWNVTGSGDFDGDGDHDVTLTDGGGTTVLWRLQNGLYSSGSVLASGLAGWNIVGTGDLDNDGDHDILLQSGGTVVRWIMQNGTVQSGAVHGSGVAGWNVVSTGDYNGDGYADVLLQNGGTVVEWLTNPNGSGAVLSGNVITSGAAGFTVVS